MSYKCFFCNKQVLKWSGDAELLYNPKLKTNNFVCCGCIKKLSKWKQERYEQRFKNYTKRYDIYLREM